MDEIMEEIIEEFKNEFHIPPFFDDDLRFQILFLESYQYLETIVPDFDLSTDYTARSLLKNRMYYAHCNRTGEFYTDFTNEIYFWQFHKLHDYQDEEEEA